MRNGNARVSVRRGRFKVEWVRAFAGIALGCACGLAVTQSSAQTEERCYPGSPVRILRELMAGVDTDDNYLGAVTRYVRQSCREGQILKLVSPGGRNDRTDRLNQRLAMDLCDSQTIDREPLGMGSETALVLHCVIAPDTRPR